MIPRRTLKKLAEQHGTPLFVVDHDELRRNYATFKKYLPRIQAYYAVKANPDPAIVKTLFDAGASFDVASMPEFQIVYEYIRTCRPRSGRTGFGTRSFTPIPSRPSRRCRNSTSTNRWSRSTILRKSKKSKNMRRRPGLPFA